MVRSNTLGRKPSARKPLKQPLQVSNNAVHEPLQVHVWPRVAPKTFVGRFLLVRPDFPSALQLATCASDLVQKGRFAQYLPCAQVACDPVARTMEPQRIHHGAPAHYPSGPSALARTVNWAVTPQQAKCVHGTGGGSAPHRCRNRGGGRSDRVQQSPPEAAWPHGAAAQRPEGAEYDSPGRSPGFRWAGLPAALKGRDTRRLRQGCCALSGLGSCVPADPPGLRPGLSYLALSGLRSARRWHCWTSQQCGRRAAAHDAPAACGLPTRGDGPPSSQAVAHRLHCRIQVDSALGPTGE